MNFKPAQFEVMLSRLSPAIKCVILFGNNEGAIATLQQKCAEAICSDMNDAFRCCVMEAEKISKDGSEIYAEFYAQSLMGGRRAIVVKNADNSLSGVIKNIIPETQSENMLILSSLSLNTRSSLITWAKDREDIIIVGCYEDREEDISASVAKMLQERGLTADIPTLQLLCSRLSPDRKLNASELDKLALYLGERKIVNVDDVKAAVSDVAGSNVEDLCYYTAGGDVAKAGRMFNRLLKEGTEAATLIRQISYHYLRLLDCVAQMESGESAEAALKVLRPPLMFYRKTPFLRQLKIWNKERIITALGMLYDCERDCKTTNYPAEQCASYTILRLAGAAQKLQNR